MVEPGEGGVPINEPIYYYAGAPLDPSSINKDTVKLYLVTDVAVASEVALAKDISFDPGIEPSATYSEVKSDFLTVFYFDFDETSNCWMGVSYSPRYRD